MSTITVNCGWVITLPSGAVKGTPAFDTQISCCKCSVFTSYGQAWSLGWTYDPLGVPFTAYLCPGCTRSEKPNYTSHEDT